VRERDSLASGAKRSLSNLRLAYLPRGSRHFLHSYYAPENDAETDGEPLCFDRFNLDNSAITVEFVHVTLQSARTAPLMAKVSKV